MVACGEKVEPQGQLNGKAMGTTWSLKINGDPAAELDKVIGLRLAELEVIFSTWDDSSVVSRLNRGEDVDLPPEYQEVLTLAETIKELSGGAFDVEVGELVQQHGFGSKLGGRLDFSGIAKGYAVDEIGRLLDGRGIEEYLFELGGELIGRGEREWQVGLESADPESVGKVRRVVGLRNQAVATSGRYRQFSGEANHLIDPRTRQPVVHDCVSVSVVAASCQLADAWATALIVLGIEDGMALAEREGIEAYFVRRLEDGNFEELHTPAQPSPGG